MHKLDRNAVTKPACLNEYDHKTQTWDDLTSEHKKEIRESLQQMQGQRVKTEEPDDEAESIVGVRCAYCEGPIRFGGHIEHFRRKNMAHYPQLTFEWSNLFLSCDGRGEKEHCGHYKDRPNAPDYNPDELIKPDEHNPDDYLYFHSLGDVRVRSRKDMPPEDHKRAEETIRVFNLNDGKLRADRRKALNIYKEDGFMDTLMRLDVNEVERASFIDQELERTKWQPYWTTIRHFLEKLE